jgi:hypothetical protein
MSLPWEICFFFYRGSGMSECQSNEKKTEVSRSHSSEEAFVMKVERRAESLKRESFF